MNNEVKNQDVMLDLSGFAVVKTDTYVKEVLEVMTKFPFGIACVVDEEGQLKGVFTDGDMPALP